MTKIISIAFIALFVLCASCQVISSPPLNEEIIVSPFSTDYDKAMSLGVEPNDENRKRLVEFMQNELIAYCPVGETDSSRISVAMTEVKKKTNMNLSSLRASQELQSNLAFIIYQKEEKSLSELEAAIKLMAGINSDFSNNVVRDVYFYSEKVGFRYASSWGTMKDVERSVKSVGFGIKRTTIAALAEFGNSSNRDLTTHFDQLNSRFSLD